MNAVIVGAGPAGLTAAYELLTRTGIRPIIVEGSRQLGGLSQTVNHHGNRLDIGGHRFFSKSDRVMEWWFRFLPLQKTDGTPAPIAYQGKTASLEAAPKGPDPDVEDRVMLLRSRKSRIFYSRKFFDYPIRLNLESLRKLGLLRTTAILLSYLKASLFPPKKVETLEEFFISRFGRILYETFFKSYTEKVWGVPCSALSAEWGAQRVKTLSISRAIGHALRDVLPSWSRKERARVETSLIDQFLYPKYGPGQLWETVAREVQELGGILHRGLRVTGIGVHGGKVSSVESVSDGGKVHRFPADYVFSTMPIQDLVRAMDPPPPPEVRQISEGLVYRDFLTVGLLLRKMSVGNVGDRGTIKDNWIYIHDPSVEAGRLQIFNNWSPYMVQDPSRIWVGVEYFCDEGDRIWSRSDREMAVHALGELRALGLTEDLEPLDSVVIRMKKAYPAYRGSYDRFPELREHLDSIENLFLIGRNGMHRYNNQDHSMLTAMLAVDNILEGRTDRSNLWSVNAEEDYHESRSLVRPAAVSREAEANVGPPTPLGTV